MIFSLAFCSPKPSYPASPLLPHQFSISNGFLFECGLGVVDSPSQETLSVSIRVFGLDLDVRWLRVGCGVGFSRLFMLHSEKFRWIEAKFLRERWQWMGKLVQPCAWIGHRKKPYYPLFRSKSWNGVLHMEEYESRISPRCGTSLPLIRLFIVLSYLLKSYCPIFMDANGLLIKAGLWESGDHDGEGIKALTVGYYPPTFSFTHEQSGSSWSDMLFRSLKGISYAYPGFIGISYGSSASNLKLDFIFEYQSSKLTVRVVEDFYLPELFFALKEKWTDFLPDFFSMSLLTLFMYYAFGTGDIFKLLAEDPMPFDDPQCLVLEDGATSSNADDSRKSHMLST
ncbi:hypothetical protein V6N13_039336 [Hibiscus sabdariffa]